MESEFRCRPFFSALFPELPPFFLRRRRRNHLSGNIETGMSRYHSHGKTILDIRQHPDFLPAESDQILIFIQFRLAEITSVVSETASGSSASVKSSPHSLHSAESPRNSTGTSYFTPQETQETIALPGGRNDCCSGTTSSGGGASGLSGSSLKGAIVNCLAHRGHSALWPRRSGET